MDRPRRGPAGISDRPLVLRERPQPTVRSEFGPTLQLNKKLTQIDSRVRMLGLFPTLHKALLTMTDSASDTAASKPALDDRSALTQLAKCMGGAFLLAAVVFLISMQWGVVSEVLAPVGRAFCAALEFVFATLGLVATYSFVGLFVLGLVLMGGSLCYFTKTSKMTKVSAKKIDDLAAILFMAGMGSMILAGMGGISYPTKAIQYLHSDLNTLSTERQESLSRGLGGSMVYGNCRQIAGAYLSSSAQNQARLTVKVNGVKVKAGEHPAQHCKMFSFSNVLYGYNNAAIFDEGQKDKPD
mgnify:CR=1 FL=1